MSPTLYFYAHVAIILTIIGVLAFLTGRYAGWLLWQDCHAEADRVQAENDALRAEIQRIEAEKS